MVLAQLGSFSKQFRCKQSYKDAAKLISFLISLQQSQPIYIIQRLFKTSCEERASTLKTIN
jgi:hypothetical protein